MLACTKLPTVNQVSLEEATAGVPNSIPCDHGCGHGNDKRHQNGGKVETFMRSVLKIRGCGEPVWLQSSMEPQWRSDLGFMGFVGGFR